MVSLTNDGLGLENPCGGGSIPRVPPRIRQKHGLKRLGFLLYLGILIDQYPIMKLMKFKVFRLLCLLPVFACSACSVVAVADAAVTVVATTVKVGATVVGTTVDVAAAGVKAVAGEADEEK